MDSADRAIRILLEAERKLAAMLRESVEARAYHDVAAVAAISTRLADLIEEVQVAHALTPTEPGHPLPQSRRKDLSRKAPVARGGSKAKRRQSTGYPRFTRDGDRLVKIGWSKKEGVEYEHRAPQSAVRGVVSALRTKEDREFSMDDLFPIKDEAGEEIPSYQAYLVLAWLRSWGAVRKASRGGYVCQDHRLDQGAISTAWEALSSNGTAGSPA